MEDVVDVPFQFLDGVHGASGHRRYPGEMTLILEPFFSCS